jgi:hypothetical protein
MKLKKKLTNETYINNWKLVFHTFFIIYIYRERERENIEYSLIITAYRTKVGPRVSPWARATPPPGATKRERKKKIILYINKIKIYTYTSGKKNLYS